MIKLKDLYEETQNVICAWCTKPYATDPSIPAGKISHGMCKKCEKEMLGSLSNR